MFQFGRTRANALVQSAERRLATLRQRGTEPPAPKLPPELTPQGSRRPLMQPPGGSDADLLALLRTVTVDDAPASELHAYLQEDFERFVHTWALVHDLEGRCLEIGANPYFTTVLLRELSSLDLTLTNFFGPAGGTATQRVGYQAAGASGIEHHDLEYHVVNVESDIFPFPQDSFDVVLFCEVIEHLLSDPVAALLEIKRVLRPGGTLILTTPNVARLENVARLVAGANLYDPYSGYGPYGRHNREFTRHEVHRLLAFAGFESTEHFTADVHPHATASFLDPISLSGLLEARRSDLGQYLFFRAVNTGPARPGRPSWLYRSLPLGQLLDDEAT